MKYDLVVIGAGPAGMGAAIIAASHGARVALVDENPVPGGKLRGRSIKNLNRDGGLARKLHETWKIK